MTAFVYVSMHVHTVYDAQTQIPDKCGKLSFYSLKYSLITMCWYEEVSSTSWKGFVLVRLFIFIK